MSSSLPQSGVHDRVESAFTISGIRTQPQAGFVKEYFLKTSTSRREESDFFANALFLRSSVTDIAKECFDKFIRE